MRVIVAMLTSLLMMMSVPSVQADESGQWVDVTDTSNRSASFGPVVQTHFGQSDYIGEIPVNYIGLGAEARAGAWSLRGDATMFLLDWFLILTGEDYPMFNLMNPHQSEMEGPGNMPFYRFDGRLDVMRSGNYLLVVGGTLGHEQIANHRHAPAVAHFGGTRLGGALGMDYRADATDVSFEMVAGSIGLEEVRNTSGISTNFGVSADGNWHPYLGANVRAEWRFDDRWKGFVSGEFRWQQMRMHIDCIEYEERETDGFFGWGAGTTRECVEEIDRRERDSFLLGTVRVGMSFYRAIQ